MADELVFTGSGAFGNTNASIVVISPYTAGRKSFVDTYNDAIAPFASTLYTQATLDHLNAGGLRIMAADPGYGGPANITVQDSDPAHTSSPLALNYSGALFLDADPNSTVSATTDIVTGGSANFTDLSGTYPVAGFVVGRGDG